MTAREEAKALVVAWREESGTARAVPGWSCAKLIAAITAALEAKEREVEERGVLLDRRTQEVVDVLTKLGRMTERALAAEADRDALKAERDEARNEAHAWSQNALEQVGTLRAERDALKGELEAATATYEDEVSAHQEVLAENATLRAEVARLTVALETETYRADSLGAGLSQERSEGMTTAALLDLRERAVEAAKQTSVGGYTALGAKIRIVDALAALPLRREPSS